MELSLRQSFHRSSSDVVWHRASSDADGIECSDKERKMRRAAKTRMRHAPPGLLSREKSIQIEDECGGGQPQRSASHASLRQRQDIGGEKKLAVCERHDAEDAVAMREALRHTWRSFSVTPGHFDGLVASCRCIYGVSFRQQRVVLTELRLLPTHGSSRFERPASQGLDLVYDKKSFEFFCPPQVAGGWLCIVGDHLVVLKAKTLAFCAMPLNGPSTEWTVKHIVSGYDVFRLHRKRGSARFRARSCEQWPHPSRNHTFYRRSGYALASSSDVISVFGGQRDGRQYNDLWRLVVRPRDLENCVELHRVCLHPMSPLPLPRSSAALAAEGPQSPRSVWLFGGLSRGEVLNDVWFFEDEDNMWQRIITDFPCPPARTSALLRRYDDRLILYGGNGEGDRPLTDVWELQLDREPRCWVRVIATCRAPHLVVTRHQSAELVNGEVWTADLQGLGGLNFVDLVSVFGLSQKSHPLNDFEAELEANSLYCLLGLEPSHLHRTALEALVHHLRICLADACRTAADALRREAALRAMQQRASTATRQRVLRDIFTEDDPEDGGDGRGGGDDFPQQKMRGASMRQIWGRTEKDIVE